MATRIQTLIDTLVTTLEADAGITPGSVYRSRVEPFSDTELPAYSIHIGQDTPLSDLGPDNVRFMDWAQLIFIDLYAKSIATNIDDVFLDMRSYVHRALMRDVSQGLSFVMQTIPTGADEPILDHSGEQKTMVYRTAWEFRLRTFIENIGSPNLIPNAEDLTVAYPPGWQLTNALIDSNVENDAFGNLTADRFKDTNAGGTGTVQLRTDVFGLIPLLRYTVSWYGKADGLEWGHFIIQNGSHSPPPSCFFDFANGVSGTLSSTAFNPIITAEANGFYRASFEFLCDANDINVKPAMRLANFDNDPSNVVDLDGTSSLILANAMLNKGHLLPYEIGA